MQIELLSKHRKSLMGIAMLFIALYHSYYASTSKIYDFVFSTNGHIGVDFFVFISSFGLYFAYKKESNYFRFEKRRFLRILPFSIPYLLLMIPIAGMSIKEVIIHSLGLTIFLWPDLTSWFTSLILFLYVITPPYLKLFNRNPRKTTIISILLITITCLVPILHWEFYYKFFRLALFFLGFYFAYLFDNKVQLTKKQQLVLVLFSIVGWIITYCLYHYYRNDFIFVTPFIMVVPGMLLIMAYVVDKLKFIQKPLSFLGDYTYQFYLIHPVLHEHMYKYYGEMFISGIGFDFWINTVAIIVAILLSVIYRKVMDNLLNLIEKKKQQICDSRKQKV